MDPDSLEAVLEYLNQNDVTDERIYATLAPINTARLQSLLNRFNIIATAKFPESAKRPKKKTTWVAQQRRAKGAALNE